MKNVTRFICLLTLTFSAFAQAAISNTEVKNSLLQRYMLNNDKTQMASLKSETLKHGGESVAALIEVMKNGKYPDKNRWMATFLLGQIMGDKSAPFLAKFLKHPHWVMRMASLKTMLALKQKDYGRNYASLLKMIHLSFALRPWITSEHLKLQTLLHKYGRCYTTKRTTISRR